MTRNPYNNPDNDPFAGNSNDSDAERSKINPQEQHGQPPHAQQPEKALHRESIIDGIPAESVPKAIENFAARVEQAYEATKMDALRRFVDGKISAQERDETLAKLEQLYKDGRFDDYVGANFFDKDSVKHLPEGPQLKWQGGRQAIRNDRTPQTPAEEAYSELSKPGANEEFFSWLRQMEK